MKKGLPALLVSIFLFASLLIAEVDPEYSYYVYKTPTAPVIDGFREADIWGNVLAESLKSVYLDFDEPVDYEYDFSATFWMTWLDENLYLFVEVLDDILYHDVTRANWDWDNIELYFDGDNSDGEEQYDGANDVQLRWTYNENEMNDGIDIGYGQADDWGFSEDAMEWALAWTDSGYTLELAIDIPTLSIEIGKDFGFEAQVGENDPDEALVFYRWNWNGNYSWRSTVHHGTAWLVDEWLETSVKTESTFAADFTLLQNYPNPFNPKTNIRYSLPNDMTVSLEVFNIRGERVAMLENNTFKPAGEHVAVFDAAHLPTGFYVYRLSSGDFSMTKKMLLAK